MATNFPGSLDSFTNPSSSSTLDSPSHAAQHANINDAVEAVQAKLGVGAGTIGEWTSYTPTVSTTSGTLTSYSVQAEYSQINDIVIVRYRIAISNNGSGSGSVLMDIPVSANTVMSQPGVGFGWEGSVVGFSLMMFIDAPAYTQFDIRKYDYTYPGGTGYSLSGVAIYKAA